MTRMLALAAVSISLLAGIAAATAHPNNAYRDGARAGQLTPGGVWDGR